MSSLGSLELLKNTELNDDQLGILETITSSNSVLLWLIEDILQFVKVEFENKQPTINEITHKEVFSLERSFKSLKDILIGYANHLCISLDFEIDLKVKGLSVESNQSRIHQVLCNLLSNAVKASKRGSTVRMTCKLLDEMDEERDIKSVRLFRFDVIDYGFGIPKSKIDSIFEPFVQLSTSVNESPFPR